MKVVTITPNPALDINGVVDAMKPDEKAYVHDEQRAPGGNAINVARILNRFQVPVVASGFLGGATGDEVLNLLKLEKIPVDFTRVKQSTRINVTVSNRQNHRQTRLSFAGPQISSAEKEKLIRIFKSYRSAKILVVGGSLPPGYKVSDLKKLITTAQKRNVRVVVDCPGTTFTDLKVKNILLIKPNLEEFQQMTGTKVKTIKAVQAKAQALLKNCEYVCVSSVEGGALLVTKAASFFGKIPAVKIRSTVGAGDSMVACMVAQLAQGNSSAEEILRWGLAASAATLIEPGTRLGQASIIRGLYEKTKVRAL
ncbi:1-phosphofructokinase family hexose kinase [Bdellovibrio sp. SKB1291214]|uniref:1-phosphofructokinase family hexose kinase n=1 Tax=Bdellovibrio sp. SKB1291214 TaxID=1732569 RepID=UPI001594F2F0|nr:1-phosphofructokinase family hexose kinase [Bdellovibrio sp. SKB1291214]UYL07402.1 1-phosphofructokinase family hexose kinase [Bdellovibrio sp. SKB1291214]